MLRTRPQRAALAAIVLAAGCAEEPPTDVPVAGVDPVADLPLVWPAITPETRIASEVVEPEPSLGPAQALGDDASLDDQPPENVAAQIFNPVTNVGFTSTYAYSTGRHEYTGNIGRVETIATVSFDSQVIGTQPAERQVPQAYLLDWGERKSIWAEAYVFIDQDCGLRVDGNSHHSAWWQWFLGATAPRWGDAEATTQAFPPAEQPPCEETPEPGNEGSGGGSEASDGGGAVTCWYWVTYDPYTGEIYEAEFLYCDDVEGG